MKQREKAFFIPAGGVILVSLALFPLVVFYSPWFGGESLENGGRAVSGKVLRSEARAGGEEVPRVLPETHPTATSTQSLNLTGKQDFDMEEIFSWFPEVDKTKIPSLPLLKNIGTTTRKEEQGGAGEVVNPLTDEEIFNAIWHPDYVQALKMIENQMVQDGVMKDTERSTFSRDEDFYVFLQTTLEYARAKGWLEEEDYQRYQKVWAEDLPQMVKQEREALKKSGRRSGVLPADQRLSLEKPTASLLKDVVDGVLYSVLLVRPAYASWVRSPDCYKDDDPDYNIPGFNARIFCCNCGIVIFVCGETCCEEFVEDCGEQGNECEQRSDCAPYIPLGCLNLICGSWPNAIWDPDTGTCGCG